MCTYILVYIHVHTFIHIFICIHIVHTYIHIYTGVSTNALEWTDCLDLGGSSSWIFNEVTEPVGVANMSDSETVDWRRFGYDTKLICCVSLGKRGDESGEGGGELLSACWDSSVSFCSSIVSRRIRKEFRMEAADCLLGGVELYVPLCTIW